jgi:hypothetical protein
MWLTRRSISGRPISVGTTHAAVAAAPGREIINCAVTRAI